MESQFFHIPLIIYRLMENKVILLLKELNLLDPLTLVFLLVLSPLILPMIFGKSQVLVIYLIPVIA